VIDNRAAFADLLEAAHRAEGGTVPLAGLRSFAAEAPCLVAVLSRPVEPSQIARWEQELSVGAACGLLCAAASAAGFAANWLTGWAAYSPTVIAALGQQGDRIAGFIFIGTPSRALDERPRPDLATVVRHWDG
jgi:nitroreductase